MKTKPTDAGRTVLIMGSARSDGNSRIIADHFCQQTQADFIDLKAYTIGNYDYLFENRHDDFLPLMQRIIADYNRLIFLTPVYWYTMSASMKTFLDRLSDLLGPHKDLGRQLRGKSLGLISCSSDTQSAPHFSEPFELSADYLGMTYLGYAHTWVEGGIIPPPAQAPLTDYITQLHQS